MQHDGVCNVSDIIVVIGKRKSQFIEALKSNIFDVGTSEAREIKKPCPPLKLPFLLSDSVANTEKLPLSVEGSPLSVEESTFDSNVSFLFCKLVFSLIFGRFASLFCKKSSSTESTVIHMTAVDWGGEPKARIAVYPYETVRVGMEQINDQIGVAPRLQRLVLGERQLAEHDLWSEHHVHQEAQLQLTVISEVSSDQCTFQSTLCHS